MTPVKVSAWAVAAKAANISVNPTWFIVISSFLFDYRL
jgi:hypothetical protein